MKPHVICHMMSPLDGRLVVSSWAPEGSPLYTEATGEYRRIHSQFNADAWLCGTNTMKEFAGGSPAPRTKPAGAVARPWHLADPAARHFAIAIDRKAQLHWDSPVADEGHVVVVLGASVGDDHLAELVDAGVSYLIMPDDAIDLGAMLEALAARLPIQTILLEGGGTVNGAFLKAGLVDEISLLLCPAIDGTTGSPVIFEAGEGGIGDKAKLELQSAQAGAHGTCHLRYRVVRVQA